jgi:hypothetical protein
MRFVVKCTFWLGLVYSSSSFWRTDAVTAVPAVPVIAGFRGWEAASVCPTGHEAACRIALATVCTAPPAIAGHRIAALHEFANCPDAAGPSAGHGANSLTSADKAAPWRGDRSRSGA